MGVFSIWHWLALVLFLGVAAVPCIWTARRSPTHPDGGPVGFGGWLLLLAIGQTLAPLKSLASLGDTIRTFHTVALIPGGKFPVLAGVGLVVATLVLQVALVALMFRRSRLFPKLFPLQLFSLAVAFAFDILLAKSLGLALNQIYTPATVGDYVGSFLGTALWTWYVFKSRRVRNTFVRGAPLRSMVVENG